MAPSEQSRLAVAAQTEGGDERTARRLLKPRRRAQIEVWLDEAIRTREDQYCGAGRMCGHRSDALALPGADQTGGGSRSISSDVCPVCGRSCEDEEPVTTNQTEKENRLEEQPRPGGSKLGKGKHMLRGIKTAMGHLKARDGSKSEEEGLGRAVSTQMFVAEASEYGSSICSAFSSSLSNMGGGDNNKALDERMARLRRAQKLLDKSQVKR
ncbi:hypothetical protein J7T55_008743 [Diaporthe amygdali]|uniref:uncharacterized protein n=1 Tax=Phomopsis amygdali TaxID=1214568 RepID=UPI0022FE9669|nr:uncharacterized protein J7T55_008743 [Diaporthe amygdali]KAJ0121578.1 hypothetical protein J7T55_008743 [Diaporthe amygdali]